MREAPITPSKLWAASLAMALLLLVSIPSASAALLVSIDMDPTTPGIQSTLTVVEGTNFDVDVVLTSDGSPFDTAILQIDFNDAGSTLGLVGGPTAGSIVATSPLVIDAFTGLPVLSGAPLSTLPAPPSVGFTETTGATGVVSLLGPFFLAPLSVTDLFGQSFNALALGTSSLIANTGLLGGLAGFGQPAAFSTIAGTVNVIAAPVNPPTPTPAPEPTILMLFGAGLLGLARFTRKTQTR